MFYQLDHIKMYKFDVCWEGYGKAGIHLLL